MTTQGDLEANREVGRTATKGDRQASQEAKESSIPADHKATRDGLEAIQASLPAAEWLHLAEAARHLRWPMERLRSLARRGKVQTRRGNDGHLFVLVTHELMSKAARPARRPTEEAARLVDNDREARLKATDDDRKASHEALLADLQAEVERWRRQAEDARVDLAALRTKAELLQQGLDREIAGRAELVEELRRQRNQLEAELAELRIPWWARVLAALRTKGQG